MRRLGLVEVIRTAAREIEAAFHTDAGGVRAVTPVASNGVPSRATLEALHRSPRLEGLRPRPDAVMRAASSPAPDERRAPIERAPIPVSTEPRPSPRAPSAPSASPNLGGYVAISEPVEIGDVLVTDPNDPARMKRCDCAADSTVTGVVSGEPRGNNTLAPATFRGLVMCKVDAGYSAIAEGDFLTSSPTRGYAMRSSCRAPGTILGRALEALPTGRGRIRVLVTRR